MAWPAAIEAVIADIDSLVERRGFAPASPRSEWTGKFNIASWRRRGWKNDVIQLHWRVGPASACMLTAQWSVTIDGEETLASACNAIYARRGVNLVDLPTAWPVIGGWIASRWRSALLADAGTAVAWCDRTSSRAGALADLAREDRNGPQAGSRAHAAIERYVLERAPQQ